MADKYFRGDAPAVAQVNTWSFGGTWEAADLVKVIINGKTVSIAAGSTTTATVVTNVATALAALSQTAYPEFYEITWSADTTTLTATAKLAGKPFTVTIKSSESNGDDADAQEIEGVGTTTLTDDGTTGTAATACTGPNWASEALNWNDAALPEDGDNVILADCSVSILYGLNLSAITPATIRRYQSFTGNIGLPRFNTDAGEGAQYLEYRDQYLQFGNSGDGGHIQVYLGLGSGDGPSREKWDFGDGRATINGIATGQPTGTDREACLILGSHASNALNVNKGSYGVAIHPGETAVIATLNEGYTTNVDGDCRVRFGVGVTFGTGIKTGGSLEVNGSIGTAFTNYAGEATINGAGTHTGYVIRGGRVYYNSIGTLGGNPLVSAPGVLDFSKDLRAKTVTNPIEVYGDNALDRVVDPFGVVSGLVLDWNQASDKRMPLGTNIRITRGAPA